MRKTVCICDRCGKEIQYGYKARINLPLWITDVDGDEECGARVDLCDSCMVELVSLLNTHFLELNDGNLVMKDAPYADIARLEAELEEATRDLEELEEELERLRDVKDGLFETNFLLTKQLSDLGVEVDE